MLTETKIDFIRQYIDQRYFDSDKLIKYLDIHDIVGNEVFSYCDKSAGRDGAASYASWLDDEYGYRPLSVESFIRRIPFYFYVNDYSGNRVGNLHCFISGIIREDKKEQALEKLYEALEYMFYDKLIPLPDIFCYVVDQTHHVNDSEVFFRWHHYLQLCEEFTSKEFMPDILITSYNEMLERKGLPPIIYEIGEIGVGEICWRTGTQIQFEGIFPCDRNGHPIMKWIGLRVKNAKSITCSQDKSSRGRLFVELTPNTIIHALNCYNYDADDDCWYQLYAGPQTMEFDYTVLKDSRKRLKYTQQEVADAIGATVRTYQKWESGDTTPDGHYLLRLLNWLDIRDIQDVVRYTE